MRFRKSDTIRGSPSLSDIFGSQLRSSFALLISGFLLCGSSAVFALNSIVALGSIVSLTTYARSAVEDISMMDRTVHAHACVTGRLMPTRWFNQQRQGKKYRKSLREKQKFNIKAFLKQWGLKHIDENTKKSNLSKFKHGELPRVAKIKGPHMLTLH